MLLIHTAWIHNKISKSRIQDAKTSLNKCHYWTVQDVITVPYLTLLLNICVVIRRVYIT